MAEATGTDCVRPYEHARRILPKPLAIYFLIVPPREPTPPRFKNTGSRQRHQRVARHPLPPIAERAVHEGLRARGVVFDVSHEITRTIVRQATAERSAVGAANL